MKSLAAALSLAVIYSLSAPASAATQTTTLSVPGMTCAACPITVKTALSRVAGVNDVTVSLEKKQAVVKFDDTKTSVDALRRATADAGYPATPMKDDSK